MSGAHVGHRRSPYRQWPVTGKTLKNHIFPLYSLIKAFLNNNTVSFSLFPTLKPYLYLIFNSQTLEIQCKQKAHVSIFLEGKFSHLLPVHVSLKENAQNIFVPNNCGYNKLI